MRVALEDLGLERLYVVYPGTETYALDPRILVVPASQIRAALRGLAGRRAA